MFAEDPPLPPSLIEKLHEHVAHRPKIIEEAQIEWDRVADAWAKDQFDD